MKYPTPYRLFCTFGAVRKGQCWLKVARKSICAEGAHRSVSTFQTWVSVHGRLSRIIHSVDAILQQMHTRVSVMEAPVFSRCFCSNRIPASSTSYSRFPTQRRAAASARMQHRSNRSAPFHWQCISQHQGSLSHLTEK